MTKLLKTLAGSIAVTLLVALAFLSFNREARAGFTPILPDTKICNPDIPTCRANKCEDGDGCIIPEGGSECSGDCHTEHGCCTDCNRCAKKTGTIPPVCECKYVAP